jgi:hypothetical protein
VESRPPIVARVLKEPGTGTARCDQAARRVAARPPERTIVDGPSRVLHSSKNETPHPTPPADERGHPRSHGPRGDAVLDAPRRCGPEPVLGSLRRRGFRVVPQGRGHPPASHEYSIETYLFCHYVRLAGGIGFVSQAAGRLGSFRTTRATHEGRPDVGRTVVGFVSQIENTSGTSARRSGCATAATLRRNHRRTGAGSAGILGKGRVAGAREKGRRA